MLLLVKNKKADVIVGFFIFDELNTSPWSMIGNLRLNSVKSAQDL